MDFNNQSLSWDNEKRVKRAKVIADEIAASVELRANFYAMEFGCGTGLISFNLHNKLKAITCIDTSLGMIDIVKAKIQQQQVTNIKPYLCNINEDDQFKSEYDLIYTSMALHHIADIETILTNLYKLLKQEGYLCIVDLDEDDGSFHKLEEDFTGHHGFNQQELKKVLEKIGYHEVKSHTFYHDVKPIDDIAVKYSLFIMVGRKR